MSLLVPSTELWGTAEFIGSDPPVTTVDRATYLPFRPGEVWGLFDTNGNNISAATDFRGPQNETNSQIITKIDTIYPIDIDNGSYIYGGRINPHFGHFLINTLPRYWNISSLRTASRKKILCHGPGGPSDWFKVPFIAAIFSYLGLSQDDFISFNRSTIISEIVIPGTSLEEQRAGYAAFGVLCHAIGKQVRGEGMKDQISRPVYYSKTRLRGAVSIIVNEVEIEEVIRTAGIDIVYPEAMNFDEQIKLMSSRSILVGSVGSYFHASAFCPPRNIVGISLSSQINSNYTIIDFLNGNDSIYMYPPDIKVIEQRDGYLTSRYLPKAREIALEIVDLVWRRERHGRLNSASARSIGGVVGKFLRRVGIGTAK